jgi:hypothetical protein
MCRVQHSPAPFASRDEAPDRFVELLRCRCVGFGRHLPDLIDWRLEKSDGNNA